MKSRRAETSIAVACCAAILVLSPPAEARRILEVGHQPYLQLGDAPLATTGPGVGERDQIVIVWQTTESGMGDAPTDFFEVGYRRVGEPGLTPAAPIGTLATGSGTRVNHWVTITELDYGEQYEYQVIHKREPGNPVIVAAYAGAFSTRKRHDDTAPFSFAVTGDNAHARLPETVPVFEMVMGRIAALAPAFVMLVGDGVQDLGEHPEYDYRFNESLVPNQSAFVRNHVEYFCMGNHEAYTNDGGPALDNYHVPSPVSGVTSPVAGPVGESPEKNYSYDYGLAHFTIFDATAWGGPGNSDARQSAIVTWLQADLNASSQPWKIVVGHYPPKSGVGRPDTEGDMAAEVIPVLVQAGADVLLCGHIHTYQRSFPLTGYAGGDVTYLTDQSPLFVNRDLYIKGDHVIEIVVAPGGMPFDGNVPNRLPGWLARAFGENNGGRAGPMLVEVDQRFLKLRYVAADNGEVMDEVVIHVPAPVITLSHTVFNRTIFLGEDLPKDTFTIRNGGIGTLNYTIEDDAFWLTQSPTTGDSTGEPDPIDISYDEVSGLEVGQYTAVITVSDEEAANSPQTILVNLTVRTVSPDFDYDGDVDEEDFGHLQACLTGTGATQTEPRCQNADVNNDEVIDGIDISILRGCLSGPGVRADPNCAD